MSSKVTVKYLSNFADPAGTHSGYIGDVRKVNQSDAERLVLFGAVEVVRAKGSPPKIEAFESQETTDF